MEIPLSDGSVHCEVLGAGRPVLALHGGMGFDSQMLRPWLDPLAEAASLAFLDFRGCGRSSRPSNDAELGHEAWIADVEATRAHLGHERVVLFGHSYGGLIALEYALRHGDRLAGLVLCATYPKFDFTDTLMAMVQARLTSEQLQIFTSGLSGPVADDETFAEVFRQMLPAYFHRWDPELGDAVMKDVTCSAVALNRSMFGELGQFDVVGRLGEIEVPTLVITGDDDPFAPLEHAGRRLADGIPNAELSVVQQSGHFPFVEQPDRFLDAMRAWLGKL